MTMTIMKHFLRSLEWADGEPYCQYCKGRIEACYECGKKTATEDIFCARKGCPYCAGDGTVLISRVCEDCFKTCPKEHV